jgi:hypothetical protein
LDALQVIEEVAYLPDPSHQNREATHDSNKSTNPFADTHDGMAVCGIRHNPIFRGLRWWGCGSLLYHRVVPQ